MTFRLTRAFAPLALAAFLPVAALADPAAACPKDAEQTLYDMETAIRQGTELAARL